MQTAGLLTLFSICVYSLTASLNLPKFQLLIGTCGDIANVHDDLLKNQYIWGLCLLDLVKSLIITTVGIHWIVFLSCNIHFYLVEQTYTTVETFAMVKYAVTLSIWQRIKRHCEMIDYWSKYIERVSWTVCFLCFNSLWKTLKYRVDSRN